MNESPRPAIEANERHLPDNNSGHLLQLPGEQWSVWRWIGLRGGGFPADLVLTVGSLDLAAACQDVVDAEKADEGARTTAVKEINEALDKLKTTNQWHDKQRRYGLLDAIRAVKEKRIPDSSIVASRGEALDVLRSTRERLAESHKRFEEVYATTVRQTSEAIRAISSSQRFREALGWQNRKVLHTAIDLLLNSPANGGSRTSKQRQYEELTANYLQRYCVKNDTIGFFGPVGWAKFSDNGPAMTCIPGRQLLASRKVYFENWGIEALADKIVANREARIWLAPIRMPLLHFNSEAIPHPQRGSIKVSREEATILARCDGARTAREIALEVINSCYCEWLNEEQVYDILENLRRRELIFWHFIVPREAYPERTLRRLIQGIGTAAIREQALADLNELETFRDAISLASGNAEELDAAMGDLESCFVRLTGRSSTRRAGQVYASRTLVYEDCRRDIDVGFGPDFWRELAEPLTLMLTSARWCIYEYARIYKAKFKEIYDKARTKSGPKVEATEFCLDLLPYLRGEKARIGDCVLDDYRLRWGEILSLKFNERIVELKSKDLRAPVEAAFPAPRPGWITARYHCPDVMIDAKDPDAVRKGNYQLVMGELHLGCNTLMYSLFCEQHPRSADLFECIRQDMSGLKVIPCQLRERSSLNARTANLVPPDALRLELGRDSFEIDRSKAIQISSLVIEERNGEVVLLTRDGQCLGDVIDIAGFLLQTKAVDSFRILSSTSHTPRVKIDRLVICRETWRVDCNEMRFAFAKSAPERFLAVRRWAKSNEIPRFAFVRVPVEVKPCYVDFDSPIFVDILCKLVRRTLEGTSESPIITVTEMLPTHDATWLSDSQGNRYTSELRIVAVDRFR